MRAVHVVWVDSSTVNMGWDDVKSYRERIEVDTVESVGFVVDDTPDHLALTMSFTPLERNPRRVRDDQINVQPVLAIPRVAIQSITDLA